MESNSRLTRLQGWFKIFVKSIWLFPACATLILILLTVLKLNGSSIGVYDQLLNQNQHSLISGQPRQIRSDEWMVNTPYILSQATNHYQATNPDVGDGQDTSVVLDVPYKGWSIIFRPQNLSFFVMPLEFAFAFRWWFLSYVLILAVYFFVLTVFRGKRLLASLLAVFMCMSPFIQWWYQSTTILSIAYVLLIATCALQLLRAAKRRTKILWGIALGYTMVAFALLMYPPFQVPCALVGVAAIIAVYLSEHSWKEFFRSKAWLWLAVPTIAALVVLGAFILQHHDVIKVITHTIYPGSRVVPAGHEPPADLLQWPLSYIPLHSGPITPLGNNQSEVARFLFMGLLTIPYLAYALYLAKGRKKNAETKKINYLFIGMMVASALLLARMFVPFGDAIYSLIGLKSAPHVRLFIALGVINTILVALAVMLPARAYQGWKSLWDTKAAIYFVVAMLITGISLKYVDAVYDIAALGILEIAALSLLVGGIAALLAHSVRQVRYIGLAALTLCSILVSAPVNPLYRGTGSLGHGSLIKEIAAIDKKDSASWWVVSDKLPFESIPTAAGAHSLSGVYIYPDMALWKRYFPADEAIYNRYAHAIFTVDDSVAISKPQLKLLQADAFIVRVNSCDPFLQAQHVNYILAVISTEENPYACFNLSRTVDAGGGKIGIYMRKLQ
jgi:hypothetical protein